ncbi:MAG: HIT family protein [bacterium]|nr:HIT family protein [bacterium]
MATIFTRILNKELPGHFIYEDEMGGVFLSIAPITPGHALVVPRQEVDHWLDLSPEQLAWCYQTAQRVGQAQMKAFNPRKVGLMIAGLEVPHTHLHVIAMRDESDLNFAKAHEVPAEELAQAAQALRDAWE